jgi:hypothetical protein
LQRPSKDIQKFAAPSRLLTHSTSRRPGGKYLRVEIHVFL